MARAALVFIAGLALGLNALQLTRAAAQNSGARCTVVRDADPECSDGCAGCLHGQPTCYSCASGYYDNTDGMCEACMAGCQECYSHKTCTCCAEDYILSNSGTCIQTAPIDPFTYYKGGDRHPPSQSAKLGHAPNAPLESIANAPQEQPVLSYRTGRHHHRRHAQGPADGYQPPLAPAQAPISEPLISMPLPDANTGPQASDDSFQAPATAPMGEPLERSYGPDMFPAERPAARSHNAHSPSSLKHPKIKTRCCQATEGDEGSKNLVPNGRIVNEACVQLALKHPGQTCSLCHLHSNWKMTCADRVRDIEGEEHVLKSAAPAVGVVDRITYKALAAGL